MRGGKASPEGGTTAPYFYSSLAKNPTENAVEGKNKNRNGDQKRKEEVQT